LVSWKSVLEYDDSRFPLVVFTNRDEFTGEDAVQYEDYMNALFERDERFATVFLSIGVKMPAGRILRRLAAWMRGVKTERARLELGSAVYLSSSVVRGALGLINSLAPPPSPQELFGSPEEALAWASDLLEKNGVATHARTG
jgi:hypothetical protein